ncbi:MAG: hypothetical protein M3416_01300 [Acidobacteriota bacterium]|nr:hypothetical protein [Acidobacteriota bacterium]
MSLNINWLNAIAQKTIHRQAVYDYVFRTAAILAYLRRNGLEPYEGGVSVDDAILFDAMLAGSYDTGDPFNTDVTEPIAGRTFTPRKYYAPVAEYLENLAVNRGPASVFNALKIKHAASLKTLNTVINVDLYRHGQSISGEDRSQKTNGLEEALSNGTDQSYYGNTFTSYGGQTRNAEVGEALNSTPLFGGNTSTGVAGQATYDLLLDGYLSACKGDRKPDIGLCNKTFWGFLLKRIQSAQQFHFDVKVGSEAVFGATSIKFMNTDIMIDEYAPTRSNEGANAKLGVWRTDATETISGTPTSDSRLPASGTYAPAEVFFWLNSSTLKFILSTHPLFRFGWTGYIPAQGNSKIVGRTHVMGTMKVTEPWLNKVIFGCNS